jgi:hypothetical protein
MRATLQELLSRYPTLESLQSHLTEVAQSGRKFQSKRALERTQSYRVLRSCDISTVEALSGIIDRDYIFERHKTQRVIRTDTTEATHRSEGKGESWAVIVAGDEGETTDLFNLHAVFDFCVDQLGRERVILIANVEEVRQKLSQAADTGYPLFSPRLSMAENKAKNIEKLRSFERKYQTVFALGGADYDWEHVCVETVMKVLMGEPLWPGSKVIPRQNVRSLFFCLSGHGGSFASIPRTSPKLVRIPCDLCGKPHARRPERDASQALTHWVDWLQDDFNNQYSCGRATQSTESDATVRCGYDGRATELFS